MTPPLPTRIAVSVVLLCIVVLLASACGFGGGTYIVPASLFTENFVLWQRDPAGGPDRPIGAGYISGQSRSLFAEVDISDPPCLARHYHFSNYGAVDRLVKPSATIKLAYTTEATATGKASPFGPYNPSLWRLDYPLIFTFTTPVCDPATAIRAEARTGADLSDRFEATVVSRPLGAPVRVTLYQTNPTASAPAVLWGDLDIPWQPGSCGGAGALAPVFVANNKGSAYTFSMRDRSTVSIEGLPATLDPYPSGAVTLTLKFQGGPCDGQVFTTLSR